MSSNLFPEVWTEVVEKDCPFPKGSNLFPEVCTEVVVVDCPFPKGSDLFPEVCALVVVVNSPFPKGSDLFPEVCTDVEVEECPFPKGPFSKVGAFPGWMSHPSPEVCGKKLSPERDSLSSFPKEVYCTSTRIAW
jgi:hypothetical protein